MSTKKIKRLLLQSLKPGMPKIEQFQARLDMAIALIIAQKMEIARLKRKGDCDCCEYRARSYEPLIKHVKDW